MFSKTKLTILKRQIDTFKDFKYFVIYKLFNSMTMDKTHIG